MKRTVGTRSITAVGILAICTVGLSACAGADTADTDGNSVSISKAAAAPRPATYTLSEIGDYGYTATVSTADTDSIGAAWTMIRGQLLDTKPDGAYFVNFTCADPAPGKDPLLGTAKVAVGQLGATQTGIDAGKGSIDYVPGARCGEDPGYQSQVDRNAPLDADAVNDLCREFIEEKYVVQQLPVDIANERTEQNSDGKWTATGTSQGASKYGAETATITYTCTVSNTTGALSSNVEFTT
ncbi:hypothetical protein [Rhodococcus spongiicola]|uniref:Lipoprotein n=1 Tax=Rhodococcus spongiicola TaxID=2487352 RepID=A0A3S3E5R0_9NOCA|nr:hypothetical protein [Rhodococcus spongiicola]RVW06372.1 hypothetical protein EF834_02775 [Rhodococcus spongiicola]